MTTSINLYRHAITLTTEALLSLDAGYNLAQALLELAEVLEDLHSNKEEEVRNLRLEAVDILAQVMEGQAGYLRARTADDDTAEAGEDATAPLDDDQGMDVDANGDDDATGSASYETYLPTPSTFIDTCLLALDTHLTLWTTLEPSSIPSAEDQTVVRAILDQAAAMGIKAKQAEIDFGEIKVLLALDEIVWRIHKGDAQPETGTESQQALEKATLALSSLLTSLDLSPPEEPTLRADILTTLSEVENTIALRHIYLSRAPGPSQLGQGAWYHLGEAITHSNKALELPTSASTPPAFKPSVLLGLSQSSLTRARTGRINDTAKRNGGQLVENALNYAVKAGESIGWGWINPSRLDLSAKQVHPNRVDLPWASGWDVELLARSIVLQVLRTAYYAVEDSSMELLAETKERFGALAKGILDRIKGFEGERRILRRDIARLIDDLEEREGVLATEERQWWERIADELG